MDVREANLRRYDYQHSTQGDPTMEPRLILRNLDNGTITQDAATDLLIEHASQAYLVGAYLCSRKQRDDYRDQLYALQDSGTRPIMDGTVITDLIDHALYTDHIIAPRARALLINAGMDPKTAEHHIDTIAAIADRDLERVEYLDNPETAPRYCTRCGVKVKAHELSRRALCVECSTAAVEENLIALDTKTGPLYTRWRNAVLVWAYTLEDQEIAERHPLATGPLDDLPDHDLSGIQASEHAT